MKQTSLWLLLEVCTTLLLGCRTKANGQQPLHSDRDTTLEVDRVYQQYKHVNRQQIDFNSPIGFIREVWVQTHLNMKGQPLGVAFFGDIEDPVLVSLKSIGAKKAQEEHKPRALVLLDSLRTRKTRDGYKPSGFDVDPKYEKGMMFTFYYKKGTAFMNYSYVLADRRQDNVDKDFFFLIIGDESRADPDLKPLDF